MRKQEAQQIPKGALDQKMFEDSQSQMFKVDHSQQINVDHLHLFNKNIEIIKPGQRPNVIRQPLQQQSRNLYQIIGPYLTKAFQTTGNFTVQASRQIYQLMKSGAEWAYEKMVDKVIPFAVNQVPQFFFVIQKKKQKNAEQSQQFQYLGQDQENLQKKKSKNEKIKIIVPLGQSDPQFQQFLKRQKYTAKYSFPIDDSDQQQDQKKASQSYMIKSESFQYIYDDCIKNQAYYIHPEQQKVVYRLNNCAIFELEGKNSIEYQLLDQIERHKDTLSGSIVIPSKLKKEQSNDSSEGDFQLEKVEGASKKQKQAELQQVKRQPVYQKQQQEIKKQKIVDNTRNVRVQIPSFQKQKNNKRQVLYE